MAQTESRTGFRLPWSSEDKATSPQADSSDDEQDQLMPTDGTTTDDAAEMSSTTSVAGDTAVVDHQGGVTSAGDPVPAHAAPGVTEATTEAAAASAAPAWSAVAGQKKPTKFLADLTRAMQAAAEAERASTLEQFQADAKAHIELVHARSAEMATEIRKNADEDVAGIRDWSKAEITRVREETERRITDRKADLDEELEAHAARIERDIERIQTRVAAFEAQMVKFFERLLEEDDPAEFAALAENMPNPPSLDGNDPADEAVHAAPAATAAAIAEDGADRSAPESAVQAEAVVPAAGVVSDATSSEPPGTSAASDDSPVDEGASLKAVAAETASDAIDTHQADDLRIAALGLADDHDAAEAEAAAAAEAASAAAEAQAAAEASSDDDVPMIGDDELAARLAHLVPDDGDATPDAAGAATTGTSQVVVTGLVSVASIAGFKRQLARIDGVNAVGVSSGPEGEFVFTIGHDPDVDLAAAIPGLSGFEAQVTGTAQGIFNVSARDPEPES